VERVRELLMHRLSLERAFPEKEAFEKELSRKGLFKREA